LKNGGNIVSSARLALYDEYGNKSDIGIKQNNVKGNFIHVNKISYYDKNKKRDINGGIGKAYLEKVRRYNLRWTTPALFHVMDLNYKNKNRTKLRKTANSALKKAGYKSKITFDKDNPYVETVLFEGENEDLIYFVFNGETKQSEPITVTFSSEKNIKSIEAVYDTEKIENIKFKKKGNDYKFNIAPFKYACIVTLKH